MGLACPRGSRGEGPSLCERDSTSRKVWGLSVTHHAGRRTTRGAAILLSHGFPGDQDPCASHWLMLEEGVPEQPGGSGGGYSCLYSNSIGPRSLNSSRGILRIPEPTALSGLGV